MNFDGKDEKTKVCGKNLIQSIKGIEKITLTERWLSRDLFNHADNDKPQDVWILVKRFNDKFLQNDIENVFYKKSKEFFQFKFDLFSHFQ